MRGPTGSLGVKGLVEKVPGGQGGGLRCPIGLTATIDRSKGVKWDDKGSKRGRGGALGGPVGSNGCLGDPMGPSGWFDESS